jgi:hypothetical protein
VNLKAVSELKVGDIILSAPTAAVTARPVTRVEEMEPGIYEIAVQGPHWETQLGSWGGDILMVVVS